MATNSSIEWTQATWNPSTGCSKISQGCKNCYAERLSHRLKEMGLKKYKNNFKFTQHNSDIDLPLKWKKRRKIFVNSMSDLFHEEAQMEFIGKCFHSMVKADWHNYQILTKRPEKMVEFSNLFYKYFGSVIPNYIWMGVSVEDNDNIWRIRKLRQVKCTTKFVSFEPLLGPIKSVNLSGIDWAIIGGESGFSYRPVKKEWISDLIEVCKEQNVKVFFKQWGGIRPKSGGRTINGRTYSGYPKMKMNKTLHRKRLALAKNKKMLKIQNKLPIIKIPLAKI